GYVYADSFRRNIEKGDDAMTDRFGRLRNIADIGDIINVEGYGKRDFQVESWTHELLYTAETIEESIIYDVIDVFTGEFGLAFQDEVSVVCTADKADEYIRNKNPEEYEITLKVRIIDEGEEILMGPEKDVTVEEERLKEDIDGLLTEIGD